MPDDREIQLKIPWWLGEASHNDRMALMKDAANKAVPADLAAWELVRWLYAATGDGTRGKNVTVKDVCNQTYCKETKARSLLRTLFDKGVLGRAERFDDHGRQIASHYWIDWEGVRAAAKAGPVSTESSDREGIAPRTPGGIVRTPGGIVRTPITGTGTVLVSSKQEQETTGHRSPVPGDFCEGAQRSELVRGNDRLEWSGLIGSQSILLESRDVWVDPLPCGEQLVTGPLRAILDDHVKNPIRLVRWQRMQLGLPAPIATNSVAELLLIVAAALHAMRFARGRPVKLFIAILKKARWEDVLYLVREARKLLDTWLAERGDALLHGAEWPEAPPRELPSAERAEQHCRVLREAVKAGLSAAERPAQE